MHAAVETLIQEADFSPRVALAVVKAMGNVVEQSQFVTVPVLDSRVAKLTADTDSRFSGLRAEVDARFAEVRAEINARFAELRAEMDGRFAEARAEMLTEFARVRTEMHTGFAQLRSEMHSGFAEVRADRHVLVAQFDAKLATMKTQLVFWVVGTMVANNYLPQIVSAITDAIAALIQRLG